MRDVDAPPDEGYPTVLAQDPDEQQRILAMFRGRYAEELGGVDPALLERQVLAALQQCPALNVRHPRDVLRWLRLCVLVLPRLRSSPWLGKVVHRIVTAVDDWSATKRLDFIDKHVLDRPASAEEPQLGPWWDGDPSSLTGR